MKLSSKRLREIVREEIRALNEAAPSYNPNEVWRVWVQYSVQGIDEFYVVGPDSKDEVRKVAKEIKEFAGRHYSSVEVNVSGNVSANAGDKWEPKDTNRQGNSYLVLTKNGRVDKVYDLDRNGLGKQMKI